MDHSNNGNKKVEILVTGGAGFIGSMLVEKLLKNNYAVTAIDNFDSFYDRSVKQRNIDAYKNDPFFTFIEMDILDEAALNTLQGNYAAIIHLAAKAGVRPSIKNPATYYEVNVKGTQHLLELAKNKNVQQFVFASSSSVYGINNNFPWKENDAVLNPISPYAGTKISGELLGHVYSHLYNIRFIGLRFFTVYGPRQRPDLAIHLFSKKILTDQAISLYGNGTTRRDYTYITDITEGIYNALQYTRTNYEIFNLGNHHTISLSEMIETLEEVFQKKAIINQVPEQPGDVPITYADISKAQQLLNYMPHVNFKEGIENFRNWLIAEKYYAFQSV